MGNIPSGSNPFATNDVKGDNLRQERELKSILNPRQDPIKTQPIQPAQPLILSDSDYAEMNRRQNETGGVSLCKGEACNQPPQTLPIENPSE